VWYTERVPHEQMDDWMDQIDYLMSPSIVESFGYSIAEAMAKGIKPLIRNRPGAIWHETWRTEDDFIGLLNGDYDSQSYRDHIHNFYRLEVQTVAIDRLLKNVLNDKREEADSLPWKTEPVELNTL